MERVKFFIYEDYLDDENKIVLGRHYQLQDWVLVPIQKVMPEIYEIEIKKSGEALLEIYSNIKFNSPDLIKKVGNFYVGYDYLNNIPPAVVVSKDVNIIRKHVEQQKKSLLELLIPCYLHQQGINDYIYPNLKENTWEVCIPNSDANANCWDEEQYYEGKIESNPTYQKLPSYYVGLLEPKLAKFINFANDYVQKNGMTDVEDLFVYYQQQEE